MLTFLISMFWNSVLSLELFYDMNYQEIMKKAENILKPEINPNDAKQCSWIKVNTSFLLEPVHALSEILNPFQFIG